jgi:hypothetical protein
MLGRWKQKQDPAAGLPKWCKYWPTAGSPNRRSFVKPERFGSSHRWTQMKPDKKGVRHFSFGEPDGLVPTSIYSRIKLLKIYVSSVSICG